MTKPETGIKSRIKSGPYDSLREYMDAIEAHGNVIRIDKIDQDNYELTGLMYKLIDKHGWRGAPALIVDKVKVSGEWMEGPIIVNQYGMGAHEAIAVGVDIDHLEEGLHIENYKKALQKMIDMGEIKPLKTNEIKREDAPSKEIVIEGDDINVLDFPFLQSNPADNGRFINTGNLVLVDPEMGKNVGTYRMQIKGPRKIGINPERNQDGWKFLMAKRERGEEVAEAAVVLGTELLVPANVEMIIEGEIPLNDMEKEGPFGEMYGYMGLPHEEQFYMNIKTITHRKKPLIVNQFTGVTRGFVTSPGEAASLRGFSKFMPELTGFTIPINHVGFIFISIDKTKPHQAIEVAEKFNFLPIGKIVIVVDKDVDIHNTTEVFSTVGARWQPYPGAKIIEEGPGFFLDPSAKTRGKSSKIIIDATRQLPEENGPSPYPKLNREHLVEHDPEIFDLVKEKWGHLL